MQPYFLPYIGYFQLIKAVDKFVIYDNIQFAKKGWINRNRILVNGKDEFITIPLRKDSDYLDIDKRYLADTFELDSKKMLRRIKESYRKAPYFEPIYLLAEDVLNCKDKNLFIFLFNSISLICKYLEIHTEFIISSAVDIDNTLRSEQKVLAIVKKMNAHAYVNPIGGLTLYSKENFGKEGVELRFIQSNTLVYRQFDTEFVPWLSILDVMMFNSKEEIKEMLDSFTLKVT